MMQMTPMQRRGLTVSVVAIAILCVLLSVVSILPNAGVEVCVSRMDTLQYMPTPKSDTAFRINVNTASIKDMARHPEVNDTLAEKIFRARVRYGGFVSQEQMMQILQRDRTELVAVIPYVDFEHASLVQYDINVDAAELLAEHPYISTPFAENIVLYREQHGRIKDFETLSKIKYFPRSKAQYLKYYTNFEKTKEF